MATKNKYWVGVLYCENMVDDWRESIGDILQLPYSYCIHDKDNLENSQEKRKIHVHILVAFPNTTTYNHATNVFSRLSAVGKNSFNKIESVINIRQMYEYLIHNTETCRKKNKFLYPTNERICGNNFDIGAYEQISVADKHAMVKELGDLITTNMITNYADFYELISSDMDLAYLDVLIGYSGHFERLIKGCYHKMKILEVKENV